MKKRVLAWCLALCLVVGLLPAATAAGNTFADVDPDEWYGDEVAYVYKEGLMNGIDTVNGLFDPTGTTSRAMVWAILARMDGETVSGATWAEQARAWAMANGVSDGTDPDGVITREMFATMLYRYAISKGYDVSVGEDTNILSYPDAFDVSEWAVPAMQWAVGVGIITNLDGKLAPQTGAQRCMVAVMLYRVCENVVKAEAEPEPTPTPTPTPSRPVDPDYYVHYHSWDQGVVTTQPTCTAKGEKTYTCTVCGETKTEEVATVEHRWNDGVVTKDPTCTAKGEKTYTCIVCGGTKTEEVATVDHRWNAGVVTAPTCTEVGYTTHTCTVCDASYKDTYTNATDHSWNNGEVTTEAACTIPGEKTFTCNACATKKVESIEATKHTWVEYSEDTECVDYCTTATLHKCSTCETVEQVSSSQNAHTLSWTSTDGDKHTGKCINTIGETETVCTYTETAPHSYSEWTYTGFTGTRTCSDCGHSESKTSVARIGTAYYETVSAAVTAATDGAIIELADGTHTFPTASMQNKAITLAGTKRTAESVVIDLAHVTSVETLSNVIGATLTFDGVTVTWVGTENYQGLKNPTKVVYRDCVINGLQYLYGDADFINCTFNNKDGWSVWTYAAKNVTFTDCTFNTGGHAVLIYNEETSSNFVANVAFTNCTFNNDGTVSEQWGHEDLVETGTNANNTETSNRYNLTFTNCKIVGSDKQKLWGNKNSMDEAHLCVIVDGVAAVTTQAGLNNAVSNAKAGVPLTIELANGTYTFPNASMANKAITFQGTKNTVLNLIDLQINSMQDLSSTTLTFDGVKVKWAEENERYQGLKNAKKAIYKNCTITGTQFMYGDADFINCTFVSGEGYHGYNVYGRGVGTLTFTDCTFDTGGRAIMLYSDQTTEVKIELTRCTFSDDGAYTSKAKAVVETGDGSAGTSKFNIVINNCTITEGFETNNSTSPLWGNKDNIPKDRLTVVIDGVMVYGPAN